MTTHQHSSASAIALLVWPLLGGFVGIALGYFGYVRQSPLFESSARIQIRYSDAAFSQSSGEHDESAIVIGKPIVSAAVREHRLEQLVELRAGSAEPSQDQAINSLLSDGRLSADRIAASPQGSIYEIVFRGATPNSSRKVVDALIAACESTMPEVGDRGDWDESIRLLNQARHETSSKIADLTNQLEQTDVPLDALLRDGELVSSAAVRWQTLRREIDDKHQMLAELRKRIESIESLITQDASPDTILKQLEQPISRRIQINSSVDGTTDTTPLDPRQRQQQHLELEQKVNQELAPLETELAKLLERFGRSHPTVVAVQRKIDAVKSKLGIVEQDVSLIASPIKKTLQTGSDEQKLAAIDSMKKVLREHIELHEGEVEDLMTQLDQTALQITSQDRRLRKQQFLRQQIQQQQNFETKILARLDQLSEAPPFTKMSLNVLHPPQPGIQVEPRLVSKLAFGSAAGALVGAAIGLLILLAGAMGHAREIDLNHASPASGDALPSLS